MNGGGEGGYYYCYILFIFGFWGEEVGSWGFGREEVKVKYGFGDAEGGLVSFLSLLRCDCPKIEDKILMVLQILLRCLST